LDLLKVWQREGNSGELSSGWSPGDSQRTVQTTPSRVIIWVSKAVFNAEEAEQGSQRARRKRTEAKPKSVFCKKKRNWGQGGGSGQPRWNALHLVERTPRGGQYVVCFCDKEKRKTRSLRVGCRDKES